MSFLGKTTAGGRVKACGTGMAERTAFVQEFVCPYSLTGRAVCTGVSVAMEGGLDCVRLSVDQIDDVGCRCEWPQPVP